MKGRRGGYPAAAQLAENLGAKGSPGGLGGRGIRDVTGWETGYEAGYQAGYEAGYAAGSHETQAQMARPSMGSPYNRKGEWPPAPVGSGYSSSGYGSKGGGKASAAPHPPPAAAAHAGPGPLPAVRATPELHAEVEAFIEENSLEDEKAGKALREVAPAIQRYVLDLGSLDGCRSRSAGCLGRIHKAQKQGVSTAESADAAVALVEPAEVESFCESNSLNERATSALCSSSAAVQRAVMDLGSLLSCRDPSAGLLGRLRDLQTGKLNINAASSVPQQAASGSQEDLLELENAVEAFIQEHELNDKASSALRSVGPAVQKQVLDLGSLQGCRSTSAGCLGRIHKMQNGSLQGDQWNTGQQASEMEVAQFISENGLNEKAANALRNVGPVVARQVMDLGSLQGCREPSAGCLGRIRDIQCGGRQEKHPGKGWGYSPY